MEEAYKLSADMVNPDSVAREGSNLKAWQFANHIRIIVTPGEYDTVENVLESLGLRYETMDPAEIEGVSLTARDVVIVKCPGEGFSETGKGYHPLMISLYKIQRKS